MFCREYLIDLNATQAAIRAGYSEKTAKEQATQHLSKLHIKNRIDELKAERNEKVDINAYYVLNRLVQIDQLDVADVIDDNGDLIPVKQWPKTWRTSINAIEVVQMKSSEDVVAFLKKIKMPDKVKNLELLGKHINVSAFKENYDITGDIKASFTLNKLPSDKDKFPSNESDIE